MKIAYWITFAASLLILLATVAYCWTNGSGHSGFDPLFTLAFFGPVFVFGLIGRLFTKGRWMSARFVEIIGFVGMAFAFFVTRLGIMNQYENWIAAGMPERNPNTFLLLGGFVVGALGGSLAIGYVITPKAERGVATKL